MKHIKLVAIFALVANFQTINCILPYEYNEAIEKVNVELGSNLSHIKNPSDIEVLKILKKMEAKNLLQNGYYEPSQLVIIAIAALTGKHDFKTESEVYGYKRKLQSEVVSLTQSDSLLLAVAKGNREMFYTKSQEQLKSEYCQENIRAWQACTNDPEKEIFTKLCKEFYLPKK